MGMRIRFFLSSAEEEEEEENSATAVHGTRNVVPPKARIKEDRARTVRIEP
jgi:hypothetical protein